MTPYRIAISAHFLTVSVRGQTFRDPQAGNTHPSIAVLIAEYLSGLMKGADNTVRARLGAIAHRMVLVSQKMRPGGNTPWWQQVPEAAVDMTYECDATLGAPLPADCAKLEYGELGADDDTLSVGAGVVKFLSSGQCSRRYHSSRVGMLTGTRQVHVNSPSRQQQP